MLLANHRNSLFASGSMLVLWLLTQPLFAQRTPDEYQVKAVFLYNFTSFVQWPDSAFSSRESPFIIGVFGKNAFGEVLEETVRGEKTSGRPIIIKYLEGRNDLDDCHIVFFEESSARNVADVIAICKGKPILTVSDADNFMESGGMLRLFIQHSRMKIEINPAVASDAGLEISSKLLKLASLYYP